VCFIQQWVFPLDFQLLDKRNLKPEDFYFIFPFLYSSRLLASTQFPIEKWTEFICESHDQRNEEMNEYLLHHEWKKPHETHTLVSMKNNHGVKESELFMTNERSKWSKL
jgi:hypothetical protein